MSDLPKAKTRPASNWSAIWVLPLIALIIGGWLGWRAYTQQGIDIQVRFESGEGIQVNKTEVVYKGMTVGKVKALALDDEGSNRGVIATIEMNMDVDQYLKTNTRFWLVKPSVSLAGITGLETLVSGNYIAASPGDGEPTRKFKALSEEPPLSDAKPVSPLQNMLGGPVTYAKLFTLATDPALTSFDGQQLPLELVLQIVIGSMFSIDQNNLNNAISVGLLPFGYDSTTNLYRLCAPVMMPSCLFPSRRYSNLHKPPLHHQSKRSSLPPFPPRPRPRTPTP